MLSPCIEYSCETSVKYTVNPEYYVYIVHISGHSIFTCNRSALLYNIPSGFASEANQKL